MVYKSKQTWKDLIDKKDHATITRRDLLRQGLATGMLSFGLPRALMSQVANAANLTCPPVTRNPGAIAQLYAQGGPTMGARFFGEDQAAMMNATMAANYGISGTNLLKLGPNLVIDTTSPFGAALMQGPPGFAGGPAGWQTTVLNKISGGGHRGPFNLDDGAGANTGLIGGASPFKSSQMGRDLLIGVNNQVANWAKGLPASSTGGNVTSTALANLLTMSPNPSGFVTSTSMTNATNAAIDLAAALAPTFNSANRNGSNTLQTNAGCAFYGNATLATPNFAASLFNPANIAQLSSTLTVGSLTAAEQALLASYYQAASGVVGGIMLQLNGRDYHGQSPQNVIAPDDIEEARAIVMFLAACHAAQAKGAFVYLSNGQAIASGVQNVTATIGGTTTTVNAPVARGDAGGSYNAGLIIFYDPAGSPPPSIFTGTINSSGNAQTASSLGSQANAVSGLYLSAYKWINGSIPASAMTAMNIANATNYVVY